MAAGLNQMVARQSRMAITNHNTEHKTHIQTWQYSSDTLLNIKIQSFRKPPIHRTSDPSTNRVKENISGLQRFQREERKPD